MFNLRISGICGNMVRGFSILPSTEARRDPGQQLPQSRFYSATEKEKRASGKGDERRVKRSILPTTKSADFSGWFASEASAMMFPTSQRTSSVESKRDGENQGEKDVASL
ncbi:hypothetical protein HZH68_010680 [Vespula germanica]|uniref:Uncharacterized protein n=1 Tax=Vespula germanica TaxID=30212 RepID=A0A834JSW8_VESGE|nr:hypothetical protein HZH68_010680 [Vespula germanica]